MNIVEVGLTLASMDFALIGLLILPGTFLAWLFTLAVRRHALNGNLFDHPNERSSHTLPIPRGGGVAIVASFLPLILALDWHGFPLAPLLWALCASSVLVALVGWMDDRHQLPARWRFVAHVLAAVGSLWLLEGPLSITAFGTPLFAGFLGLTLATLYLVWMINLYNFMDGIDGIASIEAITVSLGGALAWWLATGTALWVVSWPFTAPHRRRSGPN